MSVEGSGKKKYHHVIDLTSQAQEAARQERAREEMKSTEAELPEVVIQELPERIQRAIQSAGWDSLMPVQQQSIPYMLDGRDLMVQSRTGSGKTGAFLLPLFDMLDQSYKETQALVLTPTRELARQIHEEFTRMQVETPEEERFSTVQVYGGVGYKTQITALRDGAQVVIGTPGRILDLLDRKTFNLSELKVLILDEADEMLSMGFYPAMRQLKRFLKRGRRSYMFSATMPARVQSLSSEFLNDPGFLSLSSGQVGVDTIEHRYYVSDPMEKDRTLVRLLEMENPDSAIIFCNTKRDVEYVARFLKNFGYDASEISGDLAQRDREKVMKRVRDGTLRLLVATDVAARGIDISDLGYVFMYDIPQDPEYYVHRSGRTARAGKTGINIVIITPTEKLMLQRITSRYGIDIEEHEVPGDEEVESRIAERSLVYLEEDFRSKTNLDQERLQRFVPLVEMLAKEQPEVLAMLVDEMYRERHRLPSVQDEDTDAEERSEAPRSKPSSKGNRSGQGRRNSRKR